MTESFHVSTGQRSEFTDITSQVQNIVTASQVRDGVCQVFVPHTTAGVTINENADPDVTHDMITTLDQAYPWKNNYRHMEGNSAAHIKASLMGSSAMIPVSDGKLVLGIWQCVYFCEFDGPRNRNAVVNVMGG